MSGSKLFSASQASILFERGPGSNEAAGRIRVWRAKYTKLPGVKHHPSKGLLPLLLIAYGKQTHILYPYFPFVYNPKAKHGQ